MYKKQTLNEAKYGWRFDQYKQPFRLDNKKIVDNNGKELATVPSVELGKELKEEQGVLPPPGYYFPPMNAEDYFNTLYNNQNEFNLASQLNSTTAFPKLSTPPVVCGTCCVLTAGNVPPVQPLNPMYVFISISN